MNVDIKEGRLSVNVTDLIDYLDDEGRLQIIEQLSCHDQIITNVAAQIVHGWTEAGNHGFVCWNPVPHTPLDKAKRLLAESASEAAKEQIVRLQSMADDYKKKYQEEMSARIAAENKIWQLRHSA